MTSTTISEPHGMSFLSAVCGVDWKAACLALNQVETYELIRLLDQIDPSARSELLTSATTLSSDLNLARIQFAATVVHERVVPSDAASEADAALAREFLVQRSPLLIPRDPTGSLPTAPPDRTPPSDDVYRDCAKELGVEAAAIRAVSDVESTQHNFGDDGRPILRYELHVFQRRTQGAFDRSHPQLSQGYEAGRGYHHGGQANEWSMLYGAMLLNRIDDALSSCSWGGYQIMGSNFAAAGYPSLRAFVDAMCASSTQQLQAFVSFCRTNRLNKSLATRDWAEFARGYNGPKFRDNGYDRRLAEAFARYA